MKVKYSSYYRAPRIISPYGGMTGVRVRSAEIVQSLASHRGCLKSPRRYGSCNRNTSVDASRPARVLVLLAVLGRLGFPVFRHFAFLDRLVVLARIVLLGRRHDRRIDDLPAPGEIALVLQEPIKRTARLIGMLVSLVRE
jgi:hypothetical protein